VARVQSFSSYTPKFISLTERQGNEDGMEREGSERTDIAGNEDSAMTCACGKPVKVLKHNQCATCYNRDWRAAHGTHTKHYYKRKAEMFPRSATLCQRGRHDKCSGTRTTSKNQQCECYCHLKVCPTCKQPKEGVTQVRLIKAAHALRQAAEDLTRGVESVV
jgi:hypothetical protein